MSNNRNYKAQRWFFGLTFLLVFISGIGGLGAAYWIYNDIIGNLPFSYDLNLAIYYILIFIGYLACFIGIVKPFPFLIKFGYLSSIVNLIISLILILGAGNQTGLLIGLLSGVHLYLGLRFPIDFSQMDQLKLKK
jgi:hypothetical protein